MNTTTVTPAILEPIVRAIVTEEGWAGPNSHDRLIAGIVTQHTKSLAQGVPVALALLDALRAASAFVQQTLHQEIADASAGIEEDGEPCDGCDCGLADDMDDETLQLVAERLHTYVRARAEVEGVEYKLSPEFFAEGLEAGVRVFFGVEVEYGRLVSDMQQPSKDYFANAMLAVQPMH